MQSVDIFNKVFSFFRKMFEDLKCCLAILYFLAVISAAYSTIFLGIIFLPLYGKNLIICKTPNCCSDNLAGNNTNETRNNDCFAGNNTNKTWNNLDDCLKDVNCEINVWVASIVVANGISAIAAVILVLVMLTGVKSENCKRLLGILSFPCVIQLVSLVSVLYISASCFIAPGFIFIPYVVTNKKLMQCKSTNLKASRGNPTSTHPSIHAPQPPPTHPQLVSFLRGGRLVATREDVRLAVEQLVVKSWNERLTGLGRDARGLTHSRIQIRNVYIVKNDILKRAYETAYYATWQRLSNIESTSFDETLVQTSQVLSTIPDLPPDVFSLREG